MLPTGQFGTRLQGGKDAANSRYIFTMLNPVTKTIFPYSDFNLLKYMCEDNQKIEPEYYVPVIPMVLKVSELDLRQKYTNTTRKISSKILN